MLIVPDRNHPVTDRNIIKDMITDFLISVCENKNSIYAFIEIKQQH
jgi:hypothetical protein